MNQTPFDHSAVASAIIDFMRHAFPDAPPSQRLEALVLAIYGLEGPVLAAAVLSACIPTVSSKCR